MASLLELSPSTCAHALLRTEATAEELEKVYDRLAITKGSPPSVRMDLAHALYRELPSPWAFQIMLKVLKAAQDVEAEGADALYGLTCEPFEIIVPAAFARACKTLEPASRRGPPAKGKLLAFLLDVLLALILFLAARWLRPHPTKIVYLGKAVGSGAGALVGAFLLITIVRETLGFGPYGAVFILTGATGTLLGFAVGLFASDHVFQDEPQLVFPFVTTLCAVLLPISAFTTSRATGGYALGPVTTMCIMFVLVLGGILSARVRALFR